MANVSFSQAIKTLKSERKMTDKDLAKQLDVSVNSIYNWSKGITSPTGDRRERLLEEMKRLSQSGKANSVSGNGTSKPADEQKVKFHKSQRKYKAKKISRSPRKTIKTKEKESDQSAVVDKNLLKTYFTQLAAEKKKRTFHIEVEGLKKTHSKEITAEQWAELMTMIEEI